MQRVGTIEILPKDVVEKITNDLSASDFVKFCTNNYSVCNSNDVFTRRILKDFPFLKGMANDWNTNSKIRYLETFTEISSEAERLTEKVINTFEDFSKYLSSEYKKDVYIYLFKVLTDSIQVISDQTFDLDTIYEFLSHGNYIGNFEMNLLPSRARDDEEGDFWYTFIIENIERFLYKFFKFI